MQRFPKYGLHKGTGQARVCIHGRHYYLGPYGSQRSREEYLRLIVESTAPIESRPGGSVAELVAAFWCAIRSRYYKNGHPTSEHRSYKTAFAPVLEFYGDTPAAEFGPRALVACRTRLIDKGYCRKRINGHVYRIRRAWKWGVAQQLVPETTWRALMAIEGLRYGEAKEPAPVGPAPEAHVKAVLPLVSAQVRAMIELQSHTAARPGEICSMRTGDIKMLGDVWEFRPGSHKTQHHGRTRVILIGPRAQKILKPWLKADSQAYIFSPADSRRAWIEKRRKPIASGVVRRINTKPFGKFYTTSAYGHAVAKACRTAKIPAWSPNQLRHSAASLMRRQFGAEAAQIVLGHAQLQTTEIYAERDMQLARRVALTVG